MWKALSILFLPIRWLLFLIFGFMDWWSDRMGA